MVRLCTNSWLRKGNDSKGLQNVVVRIARSTNQRAGLVGRETRPRAKDLTASMHALAAQVWPQFRSLPGLLSRIDVVGQEAVFPSCRCMNSAAIFHVDADAAFLIFGSFKDKALL